MKHILIVLSILAGVSAAQAQENIHYRWLETYARNSETAGLHCANPRRVPVPDIPGYHAYKADLHIHTIFSDAQVTPRMRVIEAWMEDLDILAITDHHPMPRTGYDKGDRNAGFNEAAKEASRIGLKLIKGFEMTGSEPIGHINVLFLNELNDYNLPYPFGPAEADSLLKKAVAEDAYIIGNHPGWPDQNSTLSDFVAERMEDGTIQGVEVFNNKEFYPMSIDHANRYGLAMLGCTDCHYPTYFLFDQVNDHRDMTIIFAKDDSDASLKEALRAGRTLAWADNTLAGRPELLRTFIHACIKVEFAKVNGSTVYFKLFNTSDIPFVFQNSNPQETIRIPAQGYAECRRNLASLQSTFSVVNTYVTSTKHLEIPLSFLLDNGSDVCMPVVDESSIVFSDEGLSFRLACDEGSTYYTLDGTEPTEASILYDGGVIAMGKSMKIRAVTLKGGEKSGEMSRQMNFSMAQKCKGRKNGVRFEYYENDDILSTKDIERIGVLRKSGVYPGLVISDGEGKDHFGFVFTAYIQVPSTGLYDFCLMSNDGSDLYFGDAPACDNDQHEGYRSSFGSIFLQKGFHKFRIRYFEGYGGESFALQWRTPGSPSLVDVPAEALFVE